jgi:hypothetical protein
MELKQKRDEKEPSVSLNVKENENKTIQDTEQPCEIDIKDFQR